MSHLSDTPHARLATPAVALLLVVSGAVAGVALASPAQARSVTVADPLDPPPRGDIRRATYADRETSAVTQVHVRRLRSSGTLTTRMTRPGSEVGYEAIVSATRDGHVGTRLVHVTATSRRTVSCDLTASWSLQSDTIRVSIPQSCLRFARFQSRHSFGSTFTVGSSHDSAASRVVGRGGSPGCATAREVRGVALGQSQASVHARLDTAGRFGDGGAGGYSRTYRACQGGTPYWVEYDGRSKRVTGKGRES